MTKLVFAYIRACLLCLAVLAGGASSAQSIGKGESEAHLEARADSLLAQCRSLFTSNQHEPAIAALKNGLLLLDAHHDLPAWRRLMAMQGEMQKLLGRRQEALTTYRQALSGADTPAERAYLYNRIAAVFVENHQADSCLGYVRRSEAEAQKTPKNVQLQVWNDHMAGVALMATHPAEARIRLNRALASARTADPDNLSILFSQLASLEGREGHYEKARDLYERAAYKSLADGSVFNHIWVFTNLADINNRLGLYQEAYLWLHLKDSLELKARRQEITQTVASMEAELSLGRAREARAQAETRKQKAEGQSRQAFAGLLLFAVLCVGLVVVIGKMRRQRSALAAAHADLDQRTAGLRGQAAELEAGGKSKDLLLSVIGHDLRSPLASLQGVVDLLSADGLTQQELHPLAERIGLQLSEARLLLDDLLLWAKSQMQGLSAELSVQDPEALLAATMRQQRALATERGVSMEMIAGAPTLALANPGLLKTVLRNLVSNAVQHSRPGSTVRLSVTTGDSFCQIHILNSHAAMPAEDRHLLTARTPGANALHKRDNPGHGFGLVLVKDFVLLMGGHTEVKLTPDGGTQVTIFLAQAEAATRAMSSSPGRARAS